MFKLKAPSINTGNIFLQVHDPQSFLQPTLWLPDNCQHFLPKKSPPSIFLLLHGTQLHSDNQLGLGGHVLEDVGLQSPQHVRTQKVMELLNLVLFGDVRKLFQEAFEVTEQTLKTKSVNITCQCS